MADIRKIVLFTLMTAFAGFAAGPVKAGRSCEPQKLTVDVMDKAVEAAVKLKSQLDKDRGKIFVIARVGSDLTEHGLKYSHAGFAMFDGARDQWVVIHQLNNCGAETSGMYEQGLLQFMLDDPFKYDLLVVEVASALSSRLAAYLDSGRALAFYEPRYSMISYPGGEPVYQNSNQWMLELIAAAQGSLGGKRVGDRYQAHDYFQKQGYRGSIIRISGFKRMFAGFRANIRFDDHPVEAGRTGRYETVTVKSLVNYLELTGDLAGRMELL